MAEANRKTTYDSPANREDLADIVYNVDPWDTPFLTSIAAVDASATNHEWPIDDLADANPDNAQIEGDDETIEASSNPVRRGNYTQLLTKNLMVSTTQQSVDQAGVEDEIDYQIVKKTKEIRTDLESSLLANKAKVGGDKSTARVLAGYPAWVKTNFVTASDGVAPATDDGLSTYTASTVNVDFSEDDLKTTLASIWDNGGMPDCIMVKSGPKQKMSAFAGNATRMKTAEDKTLVATIDIYDGDFDNGIEIKANRFGIASYAYVMQTDMWGLAELTALNVQPLAKTGTADKWLLEWEATLEARNEKASGCVEGIQ